MTYCWVTQFDTSTSKQSLPQVREKLRVPVDERLCLQQLSRNHRRWRYIPLTLSDCLPSAKLDLEKRSSYPSSKYPFVNHTSVDKVSQILLLLVSKEVLIVWELKPSSRTWSPVVKSCCNSFRNVDDCLHIRCTWPSSRSALVGGSLSLEIACDTCRLLKGDCFFILGEKIVCRRFLGACCKGNFFAGGWSEEVVNASFAIGFVRALKYIV